MKVTVQINVNAPVAKVWETWTGLKHTMDGLLHLKIGGQMLKKTT